MHIYNAHMRWFSIVFGMINSFLVVCFTMVQKIVKSENIYKILTKISRNGYKTIFREKCVIFTKKNTRENIPIIFPWFQSTKQFMIIR